MHTTQLGHVVCGTGQSRKGGSRTTAVPAVLIACDGRQRPQQTKVVLRHGIEHLVTNSEFSRLSHH